MPNAIRNFPDACDARMSQGGPCFCSIGTYDGYPGPWKYLFTGSGFDVPFLWANSSRELVWFDQAFVGGRARGCVWSWTDEPPFEDVRGISLQITDLIPAPVPPATATLQLLLREPNDSPPPDQLQVETAVVQLEFWLPASMSQVDLPIVGGSPPQPGAKVSIYPRAYDWVL